MCKSGEKSYLSPPREASKLCPRLNMPMPLCFRTCGMYSVHRSSRDHRIVLHICEDFSPTTTFLLWRLGSVALTPIIPLLLRQLSPSGQATKASGYQEELSSHVLRTAAKKLITSDSELLLVSKLRRPPKAHSKAVSYTRSRLSETLWHCRSAMISHPPTWAR